MVTVAGQQTRGAAAGVQLGARVLEEPLDLRDDALERVPAASPQHATHFVMQFGLVENHLLQLAHEVRQLSELAYVADVRHAAVRARVRLPGVVLVDVHGHASSLYHLGETEGRPPETHGGQVQRRLRPIFGQRGEVVCEGQQKERVVEGHGSTRVP